VKIFISYRRSDTGGRAGRLFDLMVSRFGSRNIFQDVAAIEPGADFARRVDDAITSSDAVLVVIGPQWLSASGPDGVRRLDAPDDYVRREVGSALRAGVRVVPVLVDGAALPDIDQLPDDLRELANRQSVTLGDATWHQDADALVRRLEGGEVVAEANPTRRWLAVGSVVAVLAAVVVVFVVLRDGGDGGSSDDSEPAPCPAPDGSWTGIEMPEPRSAGTPLDGYDVEYAVRGADYVLETDGEWTILLDVEFRNTGPAGDTEPEHYPYFSWARYRSLAVNGLEFVDPTCFTVSEGNQDVAPGRRATGLVGFRSSEDPAGAALVLAAEPDAFVQITDEA
jgi:hypothetical protein